MRCCLLGVLCIRAANRPCPACRLRPVIVNGSMPSITPDTLFSGKYDWTQLDDGQVLTVSTSAVALPTQTSGAEMSPYITAELDNVYDILVSSLYDHAAMQPVISCH